MVSIQYEVINTELVNGLLECNWATRGNNYSLDPGCSEEPRWVIDHHNLGFGFNSLDCFTKYFVRSKVRPPIHFKLIDTKHSLNINACSEDRCEGY